MIPTKGKSRTSTVSKIEGGARFDKPGQERVCAESIVDSCWFVTLSALLGFLASRTYEKGIRLIKFWRPPARSAMLGPIEKFLTDSGKYGKIVI